MYLKMLRMKLMEGECSSKSHTQSIFKKIQKRKMKIRKSHFDAFYRNYDKDSIHECFISETEFDNFKYILKKCKKLNFELRMTVRNGSNNQKIYVDLDAKTVDLDISYNAYAYLVSKKVAESEYHERYEALRSMYMWIMSQKGWEGLGTFIGRQTKFIALLIAGKLRKRKEVNQNQFAI